MCIAACQFCKASVDIIFLLRTVTTKMPDKSSWSRAELKSINNIETLQQVGCDTI